MSFLERTRNFISIWNHRRKQHRAFRRLQDEMRERVRSGAPLTSLNLIESALSLLRPAPINLDMIRIGPDADGGYIVPNDLGGITALFSPGVSDEIRFDREIAAQGINVFLADASVDEPPNLPKNVKFRSAFIGPNDGPKFISMSTWMAECAEGSRDLMLQMDIEGAEYDVLKDLDSSEIERFRIILLEIHDLQKVMDPEWASAFIFTFSKLNKTHILCHVHPNNSSSYFNVGNRIVPQVVELSYIRRDRALELEGLASLPHPLDQKNAPKLMDIPASEFWLPHKG